MNATPHAISIRSIWLRKYSPSRPNPAGLWRYVAISAIGHAAARETFTTATYHFAPIWTTLFQNTLSVSSELRWIHNGLGVGRDARSAYSSLLGRYFARCYLTENEGTRVLVPLDIARPILQRAGYDVSKNSSGYEADWVGLDDRRLVIVEAKGSCNSTHKPWHGPWPRQPRELRTAISQVRRTNISVRATGINLPARRWAIASRWATDNDKLEPTLLAWVSDDQSLHPNDYTTLMREFCSIDRNLYLIAPVLSADSWNAYAILVDGIEIEPGFAMIVGPSGFQAIRNEDDIRNIDADDCR